jgi:outer membrane biosynthesis protein TonB
MPYINRHQSQEQIITFEMLSIDDVINVPTQNKKNIQQEEIKPEDAKKILNTEEVSQVPAPVLPKEIEAPKAPEVKPEAENIKTKEQKPAPKPKEPEKKEVKKEAEKPKAKEVVKNKKKENEDELESLLKTLEKASKGNNNKSTKTLEAKGDANTTSKGPSDGSMKLSVTEIALIQKTINDLWQKPIGAQGASNVLVTLYIAFEKDGSIKKAEVKKVNCPSDVESNLCKAIADSALRAARRVGAISGLRAERYNVWKEFNMDFKP